MTKAWLLLLAGCEISNLYVGDTPQSMQEVASIPAIVDNELDMLFLVDDSPSMADKQRALQASFPSLVEQLAALQDGMPSIHLGVVTSDLGTSGTDGIVGPSIPGAVGGCMGHGKDGALQTFNAAVTGKFLTDVDDGMGGRLRNYTGTLGDAFQAMASAGDAGCGFEQSLGAVQRALDPNNTPNAGFIRPNANLAIMILSDEDDCTVSSATLFTSDTTTLGPLQSMRCTRYGVICDDGGPTPDNMYQVGTKGHCHANPASSYVAEIQPMIDSIKASKQDPGQIMVGAIVGDPTQVSVELRAPQGSSTPIPALAHSCQYSAVDGEAVADPAVRIAQFATGFAHNSVSSICNGNLTEPLVRIGHDMTKLLGDPCIDVALAHADAPNCTVTDGDHEIPNCSTGSGDCWKIFADPVQCAASPDHLRVEIDRSTGATTQRFAHVVCEVRTPE